MEHLLPSATSADVQAQKPTVAVLPIGSFEQHGAFHPLTTDTVVACAIAKRIADDYDLFLLPPITMSLSHEHSDFVGSVSIRTTTLIAIIDDIADSLHSSGIHHLVLVNGHGGNYVLQNIAQQANATERRMTLFPLPIDWNQARADSAMETNAHEDMHAGELETSVLLHIAPELLRTGYDRADWRVDDRRFLLLKGMSEYTQSGVIGFPSLGTAEKGKRALESLSASFKQHLEALTK
ncbi:creatininase family protein [Nocardia sp. CA-145437]|uniref:creatininase family protein n=1 Tax=Nocardia sp. CA-145437 TaxID=3239980 RepID=UPI003D98741D